MKSRKFPLRLAAAVLTGLMAGVVGSAHAHDHTHAEMQAGPAVAGTSVYNLRSVWTTQDGTSVTLESLRGQPVVLAMAYTSCKDMCPMIVSDMMWIEDQAAKRAMTAVRFAFFSLDTEVDTPERLKDYALAHGLDPQRWTLFHGDKTAVRELAAVLGIRYRKVGAHDFDHSNMISLLDAEGNIAYQQIGTQADSMDFVKKLEQGYSAK